MLTWNTNRQYTVNGQRIGADVINGRIVMVDIDRHIHYICPVGTKLDRYDIMTGYDNGTLELSAEGITYSDVCAFERKVRDYFEKGLVK
jgi:hypothetical protein